MLVVASDATCKACNVTWRLVHDEVDRDVVKMPKCGYCGEVMASVTEGGNWPASKVADEHQPEPPEELRPAPPPAPPREDLYTCDDCDYTWEVRPVITCPECDSAGRYSRSTPVPVDENPPEPPIEHQPPFAAPSPRERYCANGHSWDENQCPTCGALAGNSTPREGGDQPTNPEPSKTPDVPIMRQDDTPDEIWAMVCAASNCLSYFGHCEKREYAVVLGDLRVAVEAWYKWRDSPPTDEDLANYKSVPGRPVALPSPAIDYLRLEPGDVLVFKYSQSLSDSQRKALEDYVKSCFPGHDYMILEREMDLQVVRPAKEPDPC